MHPTTSPALAVVLVVYLPKLFAPLLALLT